MVALTLWATNGMNAHTGYGKLEIGLAEGLREIGWPVRVVRSAGEAARAKGDLILAVGNPLWATRLPRGARVWVYTMSETEWVSELWVAAINRRVERVLVPCPPLVEVYQRSGVECPVNFVPMGVEGPGPDAKTQRAKDAERNGVFTFLTYSLGDLRKGADRALLAYNKLFRGDPRFRMIMKAREHWEDTWLAGCEDPDIEIAGGETEEADWWALLARADCFVFPSRGEGFGLPPREATLMGVPTIATRWLGMWDVDCWGLSVSVMDMRPAHLDVWEANRKGAKWAEPNWDEIEAHMRFVVEHPADARNIAEVGRDYLQREFTWRRAAERIKEMIEHG